MMRKGKWAGLSAITISGLMGCTPPMARRRLVKLTKELGKEPTIDNVGNLIYNYRKR